VGPWWAHAAAAALCGTAARPHACCWCWTAPARRSTLRAGTSSRACASPAASAPRGPAACSFGADCQARGQRCGIGAPGVGAVSWFSHWKYVASSFTCWITARSCRSLRWSAAIRGLPPPLRRLSAASAARVSVTWPSFQAFLVVHSLQLSVWSAHKPGVSLSTATTLCGV